MPASGARNGTKPKRFTRGGAGGFTVIPLTCGHTTDEEPIAKGQSFAIYQCPQGCGLVKRAKPTTVREGS